ncbi:MAG: hypothetical protein HYV35_10440 [Lentisphaerae bacterium]|nr:hypothetical protein [Lentisphaerota bacterium]
MQCKSIGLWLGRALVSVPLLSLVTGCELESASQRIEIRPDTATLKYGQTVTLTAYNGYIYDWSLSDGTIGALNTRRGSQVIYTSLTDPSTPAVQVVTAVSTFSDTMGTGGTGTNGTEVVHYAEAYITHISSTN